MPSIKKVENFNINIEITDENEEKSNVDFLKDVFTLDDFLNCEKTKYLLDENWEWRKQFFEEELYSFYNKEVEYCNNNFEPFFTDNLCNFNKLLNIINNYIEPDYDINIFYENTELANPLIEMMDYNNELIKINKKKEISENYNKKCKNKGKLFNWSTKKHY